MTPLRQNPRYYAYLLIAIGVFLGFFFLELNVQRPQFETRLDTFEAHVPLSDPLVSEQSHRNVADVEGESHPSSGPSSFSPPPPPPRYFLPSMIIEGWGAWADMIPESLELAQKLNRKWVMPCVRGGCIEPCRSGAITYPPPFSQERADAGEDPLLLPYISDDCKLDFEGPHTPDDYKAPSYELSAYLDMDAVAAQYPPGLIVRYEDWYADFVKRNEGKERGPGGRIVVEKTYCYVRPDCARNESHRLGDAWVKERIFGVSRDKDAAFAFLEEDSAALEDLFIGPAYRARFGKVLGWPTVPISPWHHAAVDRFIAEKLGGGAFVAFHWRSENVLSRLFIPCAQKLIAIAQESLPSFFKEEEGAGEAEEETGQAEEGMGQAGGAQLKQKQTRAILLADMPAPNTGHRMWNDYRNGMSPERTQAMVIMMEGGLEKYDAHVENVDSGVLSLRDFLFSQKAALYVTCAGKHEEDCHSCFRAGSNIVKRIRRDREAASLATFTKWFLLSDTLLHVNESMVVQRIQDVTVNYKKKKGGKGKSDNNSNKNQRLKNKKKGSKQ